MKTLIFIWVLAGITVVGSISYFNYAIADMLKIGVYSDPLPVAIDHNKEWRLEVLPGDVSDITEDYDIQPAVGYLFVQPATNQAQLLTSSDRILVGQYLGYDKESGSTTTHWVTQ
jgi:hypothetical protein